MYDHRGFIIANKSKSQHFLCRLGSTHAGGIAMLVLVNVWLIPIRYKRNIFGAMPMRRRRRVVFSFHVLRIRWKISMRYVVLYGFFYCSYSVRFCICNFCEPITSYTHIDTYVREDWIHADMISNRHYPIYSHTEMFLSIYKHSSYWYSHTNRCSKAIYISMMCILKNFLHL